MLILYQNNNLEKWISKEKPKSMDYPRCYMRVFSNINRSLQKAIEKQENIPAAHPIFDNPKYSCGWDRNNIDSYCRY